MKPVWWFSAGISLIASLGCMAVDTNQLTLARVEVPNAWTPQGEIALLQRGSQLVVRTLLATHFDATVRDHIVAAERTNWADGSDSVQYRAMLDHAFEEYRLRRKDWAGSGKLALQIEFIDEPAHVWVEFSFCSVEKRKDGWLAGSSDVWNVLAVTTNYMVKNQEFILLDSFHNDAPAVMEHLNVARATRAGGHHE